MRYRQHTYFWLSCTTSGGFALIKKGPDEFSLQLVILLLIFFVIYLFAGRLRVDFPDIQDHSKAAERIASGSMLYRDHISYINTYHYPPVFLYTLGGIYYLFGVNILIVKGVLAVFNILAGLLIYIIARHAFDAKQALFALLLFLANPLTISAVYIGYCDNFVVFFILLSIYMLIRERPLLAGAALAVAFMSKPFPVLFLFCLLYTSDAADE